MGVKEIAAAALKFVGADPMALIDKVSSVVDAYVQTPAEKAELELAFQKLRHEEQVAQWEREREAMSAEMERERSAYADTASARQIRGIGETVQAILALLFTASFFALIVFIMFWMKDVNMTPEQTNIIFLVFGAVSGIMVTVVGFYFGSSAGSKGKDDIIKSLQKVGE